MYSYYILVAVGIVTMFKRIVIDHKFFTEFKKRKTKFTIIGLIISVFVLLIIPIAIMGILQGVGILDKNFDIIEYAINASKNILPHSNQTNTTLAMNRS